MKKGPIALIFVLIGQIALEASSRILQIPNSTSEEGLLFNRSQILPQMMLHKGYNYPLWKAGKVLKNGLSVNCAFTINLSNGVLFIISKLDGYQKLFASDFLNTSRSGHAVVYSSAMKLNEFDDLLQSLSVELVKATNEVAIITYQAQCADDSDSITQKLQYTDNLIFTELVPGLQVEIIAGKPFGIPLVEFKEPGFIVNNLEVEYALQAATLSFAQFRLYQGQLIFEGDAPQLRDKSIKGDAYFSTRVIVFDRSTGVNSTEIQVHVLLKRDTSLDKKYIFFFVIFLAFLLLMLCCLIVLTKQAEADQKKLVADAVKSDGMLSQSVVEWKKKDDLNQSQLDQTQINEMYMFKEHQLKLNKKKKGHTDFEANRPPPVELDLVKKSISNNLEEITPSYAQSATFDQKPSPPNQNEVTFDLSPIKGRMGINFEVNTPNSSIVLDSNQVSAKKTLSSSIVLNPVADSTDLRLVSSKSASLQTSSTKKGNVEETDTDSNQVNKQTSSEAMYKTSQFPHITEEEPEVQYDTEG